MPRRPSKSKKTIPRPSTTKKGRKKKPPVAQPTLLIIGDQMLVTEYGDVCGAHDIDCVEFITRREDDLAEHPRVVPALPKKLPASTRMVLELSNLDIEVKRNNLEFLDRILPASIPILSTSVTVSATEQSSWLATRNRLVGFAALPGFGKSHRVEVAPTVFSSSETLEQVSLFFRSLGKETEFVQDCVGMVIPRIVCQIVNEALLLCQEEVAHPHDVDLAGSIALGSTRGPIAFGARMSLKHVAAVLHALQRDLGDPRYHVAPILSQLAVSGEWWKRMSADDSSSHR
ncbi:MAG: hypothetical protein FJ215_01925 [Ignavibacteria bacterium]|nr:hypothetical protein [Ignavibacteria bacterium]